jgi:hypothetical protein
MARSQSQLQSLLEGLEGPEKVYFQPPTTMVYPCIKYERSNSRAFHADNLLYLFYKRYTVTVIDRDPDSLIPDQVEALPHSRFDREYVVDGLNHFVFDLFF